MASLMRAARFERCVQRFASGAGPPRAPSAAEQCSHGSNSQKATKHARARRRPAPTQACTAGHRAPRARARRCAAPRRRAVRDGVGGRRGAGGRRRGAGTGRDAWSGCSTRRRRSISSRSRRSSWRSPASSRAASRGPPKSRLFLSRLAAADLGLAGRSVRSRVPTPHVWRRVWCLAQHSTVRGRLRATRRKDCATCNHS